ncbi:MAG: SDR family oxidoreductase [Gemmatimonadales bacterium]|nr:SDR family oxidoreductase [Gemmatimonadales bacterium]
MRLGLTGRVALLAGASDGLGFAIAEALVAEGARVVLNGRDADRLAAARARLGAPGQVHAVAGDVTAPGEPARLVAEAVAWGGRLDVLLANAGGPPSGPLAGFDETAWQRALELSLLSTVHLCRAALAPMRAARWGRILAITSIAAKQPVPGLALSVTARAGVLGFCKALADEVAADGITVNALCPGYIATARLTGLAEARAAREGRAPADVLAEFGRSAPIGRIGTPAEFAAVACFLASEAASYVTGAALSVDGGATRAVM